MGLSWQRIVSGRNMAIVGLTMIFSACGADASTSTADSAAPAPNYSSSTTVTGSSVDFTASLIDGSPIALGVQLAQRPVALWFWAPG